MTIAAAKAAVLATAETAAYAWDAYINPAQAMTAKGSAALYAEYHAALGLYYNACADLSEIEDETLGLAR